MMSFLKPQNVIKEGDTVIIYLTATVMRAIVANPTIIDKKGDEIDNTFQSTFGAIKIKNLIGVEYGSKIELSRGWAYVLQPNPHFWTQTLSHRTQIIYTPDISMILFQLELSPGCVVVETGTGSGSLSHFILNAIKPHGHLHTFDFHEGRVEQARQEFESHGLSEFVTVYCRDTCNNGFSDALDAKADAIFLDLPIPQLTVPFAVKAMKFSGGRICSFSPCIEQVQKFCEALRDHGFANIESMEVLQSERTVKTRYIPTFDVESKKSQTSDNVPDSQIEQDDEKDINTSSTDTVQVITSSSLSSLPGHTGFLTFATLPSHNSKDKRNLTPLLGENE